MDNQIQQCIKALETIGKFNESSLIFKSVEDAYLFDTLLDALSDLLLEEFNKLRWSQEGVTKFVTIETQSVTHTTLGKGNQDAYDFYSHEQALSMVRKERLTDLQEDLSNIVKFLMSSDVAPMEDAGLFKEHSVH